MVCVFVCVCTRKARFASQGPSAKESLPMQVRRVSSLGQEDSLEEENGNPPQYSCLDNSMDRGAWWPTVHGVAKNQTQLSTHTIYVCMYICVYVCVYIYIIYIYILPKDPKLFYHMIFKK